MNDRKDKEPKLRRYKLRLSVYFKVDRYGCGQCETCQLLFEFFKKDPNDEDSKFKEKLKK